MSTKLQLQNEIRRRVQAEEGLKIANGLLEGYERAAAAPPPPAAPAAPPPPPPPPKKTKTEELREIERVNPWLAAEFALNHQHEIAAEALARRSRQ